MRALETGRTGLGRARVELGDGLVGMAGALCACPARVGRHARAGLACAAAARGGMNEERMISPKSGLCRPEDARECAPIDPMLKGLVGGTSVRRIEATTAAVFATTARGHLKLR